MLLLLLLSFPAHAEPVPPYCQDLFQYSCDNRTHEKDKGAGTTDLEENKRKVDGLIGRNFPGFLFKLRKQAGQRANKAWAKDFAKQINATAGAEKCQPNLECMELPEVKRVMAAVYLRGLNLESVYRYRPFPDPDVLKNVGGAPDVLAVDKLLKNQKALSLAKQDRPMMIRELKITRSQNLVEGMIPHLRSTTIDYLTKNLPPSEQRTNMINKVRNMKFKVNKDVLLSSLVSPNASHDWDTNTVTYQGSVLTTSDSPFFHAYLLAHEIAHSFDPCRFTAGASYAGTSDRERSYPFRNIAQCLREPTNIKALPFERWRAQNFPHLDPNSVFTPRFASEEAPFMQGLERFCRSTNPTAEDRRSFQEHIPLQLSQPRFQQIQARCPNLRGVSYVTLPYRESDEYNRTSDGQGDRNAGNPYRTCSENDQVGEGFCDWFAYQILPQVIDRSRGNQPPLTQQQFVHGMANLRWHHCDVNEPEMLPGFGEHPNGARRQQVAVVHPEIQRRMGCPDHPTMRHCRLDGASQAPPAAPARTNR
jgi:hypothetical protein